MVVPVPTTLVPAAQELNPLRPRQVGVDDRPEARLGQGAAAGSVGPPRRQDPRSGSERHAPRRRWLRCARPDSSPRAWTWVNRAGAVPGNAHSGPRDAALAGSTSLPPSLGNSSRHRCRTRLGSLASMSTITGTRPDDEAAPAPVFSSGRNEILRRWKSPTKRAIWGLPTWQPPRLTAIALLPRTLRLTWSRQLAIVELQLCLHCPGWHRLSRPRSPFKPPNQSLTRTSSRGFAG